MRDQTDKEKKIGPLVQIGFLIATAASAILCHAVTATNPAVSLVLCSCSVFLILLLFKKIKLTKKTFALLLLLLAMLFAIPFQIKYRFIPLSGNDWEGYNRHAIELLESSNSLNSFIRSDQNLYVKIVTAFYTVLGNYIAIPYYLSFWAFIITIIFIDKTLSTLNIKEKGKTLLLFSLTPIEVVFALSYLREMPIQMLAMITLYESIIYAKTKKLPHILIALFCAVFASMMHSAMIAIFIICFGMFFGKNNINPRKKAFSKILMIIIIICLLLTGTINAMTKKFGTLNEEHLLSTASYSNGNTTYVTEEVTSLKELLIHLPSRLLNFTLSPLPWQFNNLPAVLAFVLASLPQYYFVYQIVSYVPNKSKHKRLANIIILSLAALYIICAIGTNNYGTAIRHRVKMYPVACVTIAYVSKRKAHEEN